MMRGIITSMRYDIHNEHKYICSGPNTHAYKWLTSRMISNSYKAIIIIYGGSLRSIYGWRDATKNIIQFQRKCKEAILKKRIERKYQVLLCLNQTIGNNDLQRLITSYIF